MNYAALFFMLLVLSTATYFDLRDRTIPNWLTLPAIAITLIWFDGKSAVAISIAILIAVIFGSSIGGGDIKLALAVQLWSQHFSWSLNWIWWALCLALIGAGYTFIRYGKKNVAFAPYLTLGFVIANYPMYLKIL